MSERKKKTGDVIIWAVVDRRERLDPSFFNRKDARDIARRWNIDYASDAPHRIAKVVLAK